MPRASRSRSRSKPPRGSPSPSSSTAASSSSNSFTLTSINSALEDHLHLAAGLLESVQHSLLDNRYTRDLETILDDVNDVYVPPPSLQRILPHFHSIIALCVSSGMIQSILSVDLVFDYSVCSIGDDESKRNAYIYYQ
ncbi:hypothetical protein TeGR_g13085 [Tetraparma gracilis]|uniref:Uncharacterized protein n=1 Tax=Tetraparma gracilis TaxID=2962635 RepID=A0ABQ6MPD8_9STRA|nr:hypothetical protein TeGR_g13085 [Tetraparma gracilis]